MLPEGRLEPCFRPVFGPLRLDRDGSFATTLHLTGSLVALEIFQRQLLDEAMGRERKLTPNTQAAVADFDSKDPQPPRTLVAASEHYGLPAYIERSRSKGYHVWVFFEERGVQAAKARKILNQILKEIDDPQTEVFPKHDRLNRQVRFGNFRPAR